jgi:Ca2+-binding RTX toxin-like protein
MPIFRRCATRAVAGTSLLLFACSVPSAHAASVFFNPFDPEDPYSGDYVFTAAGGEAANDVRVDGTENTVDFSDGNYVIVAKGNCVQLPAGKAQCPRGHYESHYIVKLRDGDDRARVLVRTGVPELMGGPGDDDLFANTYGLGALVYGEGGDDRVNASGDGGSLADGGPGNDDVDCCGGQIGGTAIGGPGHDVIHATAYQQPGAVPADGGTGNDVIVAGPSGGATEAIGGDGNDVIAIHGEVWDLHFVGKSKYTVAAGAGDDTVFGGVDDDTIDGGDGRDVIDVKGGGSDSVSCGPGTTDVVRYDAADTVADDCEIKLAPDGTG